MKLVRVSSSHPELINGCEFFHFDEFGELVNWKEHVACFISEDDAKDTLLKCGVDELSIALMEFKEFEYIPPLPDETPKMVTPNFAIYCNEIGFTTLGEDVSVVMQRLRNTVATLEDVVTRLDKIIDEE